MSDRGPEPEASERSDRRDERRRDLHEQPDRIRTDDRELRQILRSRWVVNRATLRGLAAVAAGLAVVLWPDPSHDFFGTVIGAVLLVAAAIDVYTGANRRDRGLVLRAVAQIGAGAVLVAWPGATIEVVGRLVGAAGVVVGLVDGIRAAIRGHHDRTVGSWELVRAALLVVGGLGALVRPGAPGGPRRDRGRAAACAGRAGGHRRDLYVLSDPRGRLERRARGPGGDACGIVGLWLRSARSERRRAGVAGREAVLRGRRAAYDDAWRRFAILMGLGTVIAALGVATERLHGGRDRGDAAASPLMAPIMAAAAGADHGVAPPGRSRAGAHGRRRHRRGDSPCRSRSRGSSPSVPDCRRTTPRIASRV
ncbi:MAG: DUF308 domain-containing protein [Acidimicrobiia bacterium]|nr:DUF308 domain-containing protein [Acidimicrobiia bacterium]